MSPTYTPILTPEDAKAFVKAVNGLHDGYRLSVQYENKSFYPTPDGRAFEPWKNELRITVLVTSIWDSVVEMIFDSVDDWQIGDHCGSEIFDILVDFNDKGFVIWTTGCSTDTAVMREEDFAVARAMKWRFIEDNRPDEYK